MADDVARLFTQVILLAIVAVPVISFRLLLRRVRTGRTSKLTGVLLYSVITLLPVILFVGVFLGLVALEEAMAKPLVTEGIARSFVFVVGIGVIVSLVSDIVFVVVTAFRKAKREMT